MLNSGGLETSLLGHLKWWLTLYILIETKKSRLRSCGTPKLLLSKTFVQTLYPKPSKARVVPFSPARNHLLARI